MKITILAVILFGLMGCANTDLGRGQPSYIATPVDYHTPPSLLSKATLAKLERYKCKWQDTQWTCPTTDSVIAQGFGF